MSEATNGGQGDAGRPRARYAWGVLAVIASILGGYFGFTTLREDEAADVSADEAAAEADAAAEAGGAGTGGDDEDGGDVEDSGDVEDTSDDTGAALDADAYAQVVAAACQEAFDAVGDLAATADALDAGDPSAVEAGYDGIYDAINRLSMSLTRTMEEAVEEVAFGLRGATRDLRGAMDDRGEAVVVGDDQAREEAYVEAALAADEFLSFTPGVAQVECESVLGGFGD